MAFTRSIHVATTVLALTSAASAIRVQPRHDGRSHQRAHDAAAPELRARQVNGAVGGIQPQSSRTATATISTPTNMPIGNGPLTLTSTLPSNYATPSPNTVVQPSNVPTGEADPYIFPSPIIQVPVATICPDTPSFLPNTTAGLGLVNATAFLPNGSSTVYLSSPHSTNSNSFNTSNYTPVPLPSPISVCHPDVDPSCPTDPGTTFSPTPIPLPSANATATANNAADRVVPDSTARILLDSNGCQTIYSPSYTAVCMTTVRMVGMPEATVTECGQWLTFSSDLRGCGPRPTDPVGPEARNDGDDDYRASTTGPVVLPSAGSTLPTISIAPGTYYAAHWVDLARGGVPNNVRVAECQGGQVMCQTFRERWSESKITGVLVKENVASFEGPAILTSGSSTITTTLSFSSTVTKSVTTVSATVVRQRLDSEPSTSTPEPSSSLLPSSETAQEPPRVTVQLVKVTPTTISAPTPSPAAQTESGIQDQQKDAEDEAKDASEDGILPIASDGAFYDDGHKGDNGIAEEGEDGVATVTVEETHTSTHLVDETRTRTP